MTFNESFWLASAAAAPVIALAAVVALPDTSGIFRDEVLPTLDEWTDSHAKFRTAMQAAGAAEPVVDAMSEIDLAAVKSTIERASRPLRIVGAAVRWIAVGNVVVQAVLLALSLVALAYEVTVIPRWLAIVLTVGGVVLLALTVSLVSEYRTAARAFPQMIDRRMTEQLKEMLRNAGETARGETGEHVSPGDGDTRGR